MFKFLTCFALCAASALAQSPDINEARTTIPYRDLKLLWEAAYPAKPAKPKPPVAAALLSARYQLAVQAGQVEGVVEMEAQCFSDDWTLLELIGSETQIDRVEPADAKIVEANGHYALVTQGVGKTKVSLHFAAPLAIENGSLMFSIPFAPASIKTVAITGVPEGKTVLCDGGTSIPSAKGTASFRLPGNKPVKVAIAPLPEPITPTRWKTESRSMVGYAEGRLHYEAHVAAFGEGGSGLEIDLKLPLSARVLEVKGEDVANWSAGKTLRVAWKSRDLLTREFDLVYEIPQPATPGEWKLHAPMVVEGEPGGSLFAVAGEQGMEIRPVTPLLETPGRWLALRSSRESVVIVGSDGLIDVEWLPRVATTRAVIETAQNKMRVVSDGALLKESIYTLRHEGPLAWQLQLPAGSHILTCTVNGRRTDPVNRGEAVIELALPAPEEKSLTEVNISYTAKKPPFEPVSGQLELELPQTALLIHKLEWELQLPASYDVVATEGNTESAPGGKPGLTMLRKELCKDERPNTRLFYQKPETR